MYSKGGNEATMFFLTVCILAALLGVATKFLGAHHLRVWRSDTLAEAGPAAWITWAVTALACGFFKFDYAGCTQGDKHCGWRLWVVETFIIILTFTQLLCVLVLHAGELSSMYGPRRHDINYGLPIETPRTTVVVR
ncbi:hypothetical protein RJ639_044240 [Escallonia herrerae]|uniref:Uncharacterized protein n=1 Tax=Escallonia herrerae TaxID=1293975 RepID=A0AA89AZT0_9ASTE|nr:hypothetical protein RJ639_044240 [Escallonia herrerae]